MALVSAGIVVASIMIGLGVGTGTAAGQNIFTDLVNDCVSVIQSDYDFIDEEGIVQLYTDNSAETARYYAHRDMVDAVREWMFESGTVTGGDVAEEGYAYYGGALLPIISIDDSFPYQLILIVEGNYRLIESTQPFYKYYYWGDNEHYGYTSKVSSQAYTYMLSSDGSKWEYQNNTSYRPGYQASGDAVWANYDVFELYPVDGSYSEGDIAQSVSEPSSTCHISVSEGLTAYEIAPKDEDFSIGYSEWSACAVTVPAGTAGNASDISVVPVGIGNTLEDTISATQEDVWNGVSSYTGTSSGTGSGTGTGTSSGTGTGSGTVTGTDLSSVMQILNNIHSYQQTGTVTSQTKIDGLGEMLGVTNGLLESSNAKLESIMAANAFGFETVVESVAALPGTIGDELTDIETQLGVIAGAVAGTQTGTLTDILTGVQAITDAVTDTKEETEAASESLVEKLMKVLIPSASEGTYSLALSEFFPFCLPYDMYNFMTILRATPQAPVFTWPIKAPAIGLDYEIKIDLSPWDDVAALFRKMELLAFAFGLAYVSRDKFVRS